MFMFKVIKRNGEEEHFSLHKLEKVVNFVSEDLNIDLNKFSKAFEFTFKDKITTKEIQKNLIHTANFLTYDSESKVVNKDFAIMANRLFLLDFWKEFKLRRESEYNTLTDDFGMFKSSNDWIKHIEKYVKLGVYDERLLKINKEILKKLYVYAKKVNSEFEDYVYQHFMWNNFYYQTLKFKKSYLIKYKNKEIETFEEALLLLSIMGFLPDYKKDKELFIKNVKKFYKHLVNYHFIPATPQLLNLRRKDGNLSSCNIFDINDNLESIYYSLTQAALISKRAGGIGIYAGKIRPSSSYIQNNYGLANHITTWLKLYNQTMVAVNQGGIRKGSSTIALPIWHKDIQEFISSKNPLGEQRYKLYDIFPQVVMSDVFIKYLKDNKDFYLIDLFEVKTVLKENPELDPGYSLDLVELVGEDLEKAYNYIVGVLIKEKKVLKNYIKVNPIKLLTKIFKNITNSGLPYIFFEDNVNKYSPFKEKIYCGNLCQESFSPFKNTNPEGVKPGECIEEDKIGYAHSCNLFSLNLPRLYEDGILFDDRRLKDAMNLVVRYMDNIIFMTTAPVKEVKKHNDLYRTIGIGYLGFADLMVKLTLDRNKLYTYKYTKKSAGDEKLKNEYKENLMNLIKETFGRVAFYSMLASTELAKERGTFKKYEMTKWKDFILLGQWDISKIKDNEEELKEFFEENFKISNIEDIKRLVSNLENYGIRNSMLLNCPPNTSTSLYAGVSASILPPFNLFTSEKQQSASYLTFPRYIDYALYYDTYKSWDIDSVLDIVEFVANVQKYIDSGISFDYPINVNLLGKNNIPDYLFDLFYNAHKLGIKTLYYSRPITTQGTEIEKEECESCAN